MTSTFPLRLLVPLTVLAVSLPAQFACGPIHADDGFDAGCCVPPMPSLPSFPSAQLQASWACYTGCTPDTSHGADVSLGAPTPIIVQGTAACDYYWIPFSATLNPGNVQLSGTLAAKYARNFAMDLTGPTTRLCWRFLVNADLSRLSGGSLTSLDCPLPPCMTAGPAVFPALFHGHVDYACDITATTTFQVAISLHHLQGCISHGTASTRWMPPFLAHTGKSYHLVGPAPFNFGNVPEPQGSVNSDAVRTSFLRFIPQLQYQCSSESRQPIGVLSTAGDANCLCSAASSCTGPGCFQKQILSGWTNCGPVGGTLQSYNSLAFEIEGLGAFEQTGFIVHKLGTFGDPTTPWYGQRLCLYIGILEFEDPCAQAQWTVHAVTGVGTSNLLGAAIILPGAANGPNPQIPICSAFIDLQNILPVGDANLYPGYGEPYASDAVWNLGIL